ncbi:MAG: LTA synthase family protein, partial [Stellaceae bacterium]
LGPYATLYIYGLIARHERSARRACVAAPAILRERSSPAATAGAAPVVLVQCESFFDARRLAPQRLTGLLPGFAGCCAGNAVFGRFDVSGWGANTMRAEFAAVTGIADAELGYDRFNPYHAFARVPIASLAWELRAAGYRTICLHPFDRWFYRRDLALPVLGFERFLGRESLGGARRPPYCPDPDLAGHILRTLDTEGPRVFIFAITMGNHGPWSGPWPPGSPAPDPVLRRLVAETGLEGDGELLRYLDGLSRSDAMLDILVRGFAERGCGGLLAFYGDHLPSLPRAFRHFGFDEWASDYVLWRNGAGRPHRLDLPAHRLSGLILDTLYARRPAAAEAAGALG